MISDTRWSSVIAFQYQSKLFDIKTANSIYALGDTEYISDYAPFESSYEAVLIVANISIVT